MKNFIRNCPTCNITITYKSEKLLKQAVKRNSKCYRGCLGSLKDPSKQICSRCKEEKSKNEFGTTKGLTNRWCKNCWRAYSLKAYYKHKQARSKNAKKWRSKNPNYGKEYYKKARAQELSKNKRWRDKNPNYFTNYRKNNKDKMREASRRRRANSLKVGENYTINDEAITMSEFNKRCYNCGSTSKLHIDHHRPLSKGYPLKIDNAVILCSSCNSSKGSRNPEDFYTNKKYLKLERKLKAIAIKHSATS